MTPNHETDTLDGLIARWRKLATDSRDERGTHSAYRIRGDGRRANCFVRAEVWDGVADELAPILAGLRKLSEYCRKTKITDSTFRDGAMHAYGDAANKLDKWLGQPATADQTGAGRSGRERLLRENFSGWRYVVRADRREHPRRTMWIRAVNFRCSARTSYSVRGHMEAADPAQERSERSRIR